MRLDELISGLPVRILSGQGNVTLTGMTEDSRQVKRGNLFIARPGTKSDGRTYINDAIAAGAAAILIDESPDRDVPQGVTVAACQDTAKIAAILAERHSGNPTSQLRLIGITGTNGKTTTAYLVRHLLNRAGVKCGLIGTVQIDDGQSVHTANLTTPPAIELSGLIQSMVTNGCKACVMEASSHALHQKRTAGLNFHVGVFTNLTGDHLDYHGTMDEYLNAKAMLFENLAASGFAILNSDDAASSELARRTRAQMITCSVQDSKAACYARIGAQTINSIEVFFVGPWGKFECKLPLIGRHNVCNALQALAVGHVLGLDRDVLFDGISTCKAPPGRLEPVTTRQHDFAVLVDYAHTDDALENVLRALRPVVPTAGKLRVVFGCGGDRDRTKRPRMAKVACRYADDIVITSDNPRTEDPHAIVREIQTGVPNDCIGKVKCIVDRAAAIHDVIARTRDGDIVLIAGKGHEDYQIIGTVKRPFDDRCVAAEALCARETQAAAQAGAMHSGATA